MGSTVNQSKERDSQLSSSRECARTKKRERESGLVESSIKSLVPARSGRRRASKRDGERDRDRDRYRKRGRKAPLCALT